MPHILAISSENPLPRKQSSSSYRRTSFKKNYHPNPVNKNTVSSKKLLFNGEEPEDLDTIDPDSIKFNSKYFKDKAKY